MPSIAGTERNGARVMADASRGKGRAIRQAIPHIRTPVTVFLDADGSHDPEDIPLLVQPILAGDADHVVASRLRGGSSELHGGFDEFLRLAGSSFITACINWRFKCRLSDSQNGFRAVRTSVLRQLDLFATGAPGFDAEFRALRRTELSHGAWVDHVPGWVSGHDALFDELESGLEWRRETMQMYDKTVDVPRLLAIDRSLSEQVERDLQRLHARAKQIVRANRPLLDALVEELLQHRRIGRERFLALVAAAPRTAVELDIPGAERMGTQA